MKWTLLLLVALVGLSRADNPWTKEDPNIARSKRYSFMECHEVDGEKVCLYEKRDKLDFVDKVYMGCDPEKASACSDTFDSVVSIITDEACEGSNCSSRIPTFVGNGNCNIHNVEKKLWSCAYIGEEADDDTSEDDSSDDEGSGEDDTSEDDSSEDDDDSDEEGDVWKAGKYQPVNGVDNVSADSTTTVPDYVCFINTACDGLY